jgi:hypothetical protein
MTEEEFKKALDEVVLKGINTLGAATVLGTLAIANRFTEVIYDMSVVSRLQVGDNTVVENKEDTSQ